MPNGIGAVDRLLTEFIDLLSTSPKSKADLLIEAKRIVALREKAAEEYKTMTDDERDTRILSFGEEFTRALGG